MQTLARHLLAAALLLTAPALHAGNVINTLGNTQDGQSSLPNQFNQLARAFTTGGTATRLTNITVQLVNTVSSNNARVQLWTSSGSSTVPETLVEDLGTIAVADSGFTNQTFTSLLNPLLTANTRYWVSVSYATGSFGTFSWGNSTGTSVSSDISSNLVDARASSTDGGATWSFVAGTRTQLFSVTSVNERTVTNTNDNGAGSLREALAAAASAAGPDIITFDPSLSGQTINFTSFTNHGQTNNNSALVITNDTGGVTIDATALPGGLSLSDNGNASYRLLHVSGSTVTLRGLTFRDGGFTAFGNTSGGALHSVNSTVTIERCTFSGNRSDGGGAIYSQSGSMNLSHCTFSGNTTLSNGANTGDGGAIFNYQTPMSLTHCTVAGNSSPTGQASAGGIMNLDATLTLTNTIVAGNTTTNGADGDVRIHTGSLIFQGKNIIPNLTGTNSGTGSISTAAPQLAGLAYYGGGTATMPPLAGSPAIDPSGGDSTSSYTTDQRGQPRVVNGTVDIGAVENSASALSAVVTTTADSGLGSLRATIAAVPTGSTITFDPTVFTGATTGTNTITLSGTAQGSVFTLAKAVTIDATGIPGGVTLNGGLQNIRFFTVNLGASLTLRDLTLANGGGASFIGGGAIYNDGTLTLTRCTLSGNQANYGLSEGGGAIYNLSTATLTRCTLSGNSTAGRGGAIISLSSALDLTHCTLSGNSANTDGGAIYNSNGLTLNNTLVGGNTAPTNPASADIYNSGSGTITRTGVNLVQAMQSFGTVSGTGTILNDAPQLLPLGNYGGPTPTMPPMAGSPAIDATSETSITDQRGFTAQDGDANASVLADIGAAEAQVLLVTTATDEDNGNTAPSSGNGTSLREAIADTSGHADIIRFSPAVFDGQPAAIIRLTVPSDDRQQITIARSLSVDARDLPSGLTLSGDSGNDGTPTSDDTRIFFINSGQTVAIHGLTLRDGNADFSRGGGIYNLGTLTLIQSTLSGNHADGGLGGDGGGGIFNQGTLTLTQCTLSGNHADGGFGGGGGGILNNDGTLTLIQSTLSGNHADNSDSGGGGILTSTASNFTSTYTLLTHCTLTGNTASTGGGIYNIAGRTTLTHCTVSGNTAAGNQGSGVASSGNNSTTQTAVQNSIISGNGGSSVDYLSGNWANSFQSQGRNLIGSGNATGAFTGANIINDTPLLGTLASNGGPTQTMALLPGSPAINAAISSTATTDQRGFPLVGTADLGATESQGSSVTLTSSDNPSIEGQSLTFTATVNELDPRTITPTGTVTFTVDGTSGSPVALNGSGIATFTTSTLTAGSHNISATYNGDANLLASTSSTLNQTVLDLTVGNTNDSGPLTLRQALANAALHPGPDTITLSSTQTVTLTSELLINDSSGAVTIDASGLSDGFTLSGNNATRLISVSPGSNVTLLGLTLTQGNGVGAAQNGHGGAVLNQGTLTVDRCTLTANTAGSGGGIANDTNGILILRQSTLTANQAPYGGAIENRGSMELIHATVVNNTAGSALTSGYAGGVLNSGGSILSVINCIIAGNVIFPATASDVFSFPTVAFKGVNLIQALSGAGIKSVPSNVITTAPLLNALGNYGGPTQTMSPQPGSPAIDQASVLNPALTTDQRGLPRPLGVRPDIGAVEGTVIIVTTPVDELDAPGALGNGVSLREAVRDVEAGGIIAFDRAVFTGASTTTVIPGGSKAFDDTTYVGTTATTNFITLTKGPLNPPRNCTLLGTANPGGIWILHTPTITQQPLPLSVSSGAAASFGVTVSNVSGGLATQWRKNSVNLPGQTTTALNLNNVQEADEALYDVTLGEAISPGALSFTDVHYLHFAATSQPASLIVDGSPVHLQRGPSSAMLALGSSQTLSVVATGPVTPALTYQWKKNGVNLSGATKSSYVITNAQLAHAGAYTCLVKSGVTSATSNTAEIGVVDTRAKTVNLKVGGSTTIAVSAAGNGLQPFMWLRDATTLTPTAKSFLIKPAAIGDAGLYTCTVAGLAGQLTTGCNTLLNVSDAAPALVTPLTLPPAFIGQAYFYQLPVVSTAGALATSFSISGALPKGITFDKTTGVLSGRPMVTKAAGYPLSFKAINAFASSAATAPATLTVDVVPPTAVGSFAGPMARSVALNGYLGGRFDLTCNGNGMCSGSITLGARAKIPFKNQLLLSHGSGDVILRANIPGITLADKTLLTAYVEVFATDHRAVLTLVHPGTGETLITPAWRNPWLLSKTLALNNPATAYAAYYTVRLDCGTGGTVSPSGYGYTSFTISTAGTLTLAGKLPDGSAITGGAFVSKDGEIALFNLLYGNRGSHVGQFVITATTPVTENSVSGSTTWLKPAPLTATTTDTVYKDGFGPMNVTAAGAPYVAPAKGAIVPGFTAVALGSTNAKLAFTLGGLDTALPASLGFNQPLRIHNPSATGLTNSAVPAPPVSNTTKITAFDAKHGSFAGSFTIPGATAKLDQVALFSGQLVKVGATTQGYGYHLLPGVPTALETVKTSPKLSGRVELSVP